MKNIVVIGDIMLDTWLYGDVDRISPEAPIPILDVKKEYNTLGGAGNVAANLNYLGVKATLIGGIGEDISGNKILKLINDHNLGSWIYPIKETHHKLRVCSGQQQIVRVDKGSIDNTDCSVNYNLNDQNFDAIIVSDYGKGAICRSNIENLSELCKKKNAKLLIDPYPKRDFYCGIDCDLIKLNKKEAEAFARMDINDFGDAENAARILMVYWPTKSLVITLGKHGMIYVDRDKTVKVENDSLKVYDVCGAGDVVISVLAFIMSMEHYSKTAMVNYASKAGRIAVSKKGTSFVTREELFEFQGMVLSDIGVGD